MTKISVTVAKVHRNENIAYIASRVKALKSKLLTKGDFEKLIKMDIYSFINFLEEKGFEYPEKGILDLLPSQWDVVEGIVDHNLRKTLNKVYSFSGGFVRKYINAYLIRYDVENLKTLIRGKLANESFENIKPLLLRPGCILSMDDMERIYREKDIIDLISASKLFRVDEELKNAIEEAKKEGKVLKIENVLDMKYYEFLRMFTLKNEGKMSKDILLKFAKLRGDITNILLLYKMKREGFKKEECTSFLLNFGLRLGRKTLEYLASAENLEDLDERIKNTPYGKVLEGVDKKETLFEVEERLKAYYYNYAKYMLHESPISIAPVIAYIVMKECESRNIKFILRAKERGFDEEFIKGHVVMLS